MIFSVIHKLSIEHKVSSLCKIGKVSRSGYYRWIKYRLLHYNKDEPLVVTIKQIQKKHRYVYGYRKITSNINKYSTVRYNSKRIYRVMRENGLMSVVRRRRHWYGKKSGLPKKNILNRDFQSSSPNRKFVTDITEITMFGKRIYLSAILDLYNNEIISYKISNNNTLKLAFDTVKDLADKRRDQLFGSIFHSDQGFQYTHNTFKNKIENYGMIQSMSRKGNPLDNACIENFFGIMKVEILYNETLEYKSMQHFIKELHKWIKYYNGERIQKRLHYKSPLEYKKVI